MRQFLHKITPLFVVCVGGIIFLGIQFFIPGNDYNIFPYLVIIIIILALAFAIDRFLVSKISYKKLFIFEIIFLLGASLWYRYSIRYTEINIETTKSYFFVVYKENGLKKSGIPSKGLFSKSMIIRSDNSVILDYELLYKVQINPPESWKGGYSSNGIDTTINHKKVAIAIYASQMTAPEQIQLLKNEARRLNKYKFRDVNLPNMEE